MKNQIRKQKTKKGGVPKVKARLKTCLRCDEVFSTDYPNGFDQSYFCGECIEGFNAKVASKVKQGIQDTAKKIL
jgi:hypothetical protein